ncbi:MAG: tRNA (adenosine(37)-N6)-threonylcarbamoyltransferase complex ATPase subunit type 1 TsaE [Phoenicibacter congonensis]|uniref:tRNA threonylcarbamoyladenosine biosynthesis protein TsaE n=1 Tax=Phoenicibacter congonensis TaxID=1944646 RepID=A0AA43U945_9ACTN|nr:tRNA (adenosine(37)-N6)-threonylcarbamoyltransferase complex ATPase subunit type 1 TsaE [Phoenicibacter congonensis]
MKKITVNTLDELDELAAKLAPLLEPTHTFLLNGNLGSGKSEFVSRVAAHAGVKNEITSPTFCFINEYEANNFMLYHFDVYRLNSEDELSEIGFDECGYNPSDGVSFIEWADLFSDSMPTDAVRLEFSGQGSEPREIMVDACGPQSQALVEKWLA